jgi:hypothetical protein
MFADSGRIALIHRLTPILRHLVLVGFLGLGRM